MRRFKNREELRQSGWCFEKDKDNEYVFQHPYVSPYISLDMLKKVHNLSEESCLADFPMYEYAEQMFIELEEQTKTMTAQTPFLKTILTQKEYRIFLKAKTLEQIVCENYEEAKISLNELLEAND